MNGRSTVIPIQLPSNDRRSTLRRSAAHAFASARGWLASTGNVGKRSRDGHPVGAKRDISMAVCGLDSWQLAELLGRRVVRLQVRRGWLISTLIERPGTWAFFFLRDREYSWQLGKQTQLIVAVHGFELGSSTMF